MAQAVAQSEEELRESYEAAYNILQAINVTASLNSGAGEHDAPITLSSSTARTDNAPGQENATLTETPATATAKTTKGRGVKGGKKATKEVPPLIFAADTVLPTPPPTTSDAATSAHVDTTDPRTQLQVSLALLAAQLAEIAAESSQAPILSQTTQQNAGLDSIERNLEATWAKLKAYKRGRFEKNVEGKYRLGAGWMGRSVSFTHLLLWFFSR